MNLPKPKTYANWKLFGNEDIITVTFNNPNVFVGYQAGTYNNTNIAIGTNSLYNITTGTNCVVMGHNSTITGNNSAVIGNDIELNEYNTLYFNGELKLRDNRHVLQELNELQQELQNIKEKLDQHIHGH